MSDSSSSWFTFNAPRPQPKRSTRVKLLGSILAIVEVNGTYIRASLHQLSTAGGVLQVAEALEQATHAVLVCHVGSTTLRARVELLRAMWSTKFSLQPFRFVGLSDLERIRLDADLQNLLASSKPDSPRIVPRGMPSNPRFWSRPE